MPVHWAEYPERVETFGNLLSILETLDRHEMESGFTAPDFQPERQRLTAYTVDFHNYYHQFHPRLDQMPGLEQLLDRFDIDGYPTLTQRQARELRRRAGKALNRNGASLDTMSFTEIVEALDAAERVCAPPTAATPTSGEIKTFGDFIANVRGVELAVASARATADSMNGEPGTGYWHIQAGVFEATARYREHPSFHLLEAYVNGHYGAFTYDHLLRVRGDVCRLRNCGTNETNQLSVEEVVATLSCPGAPVTTAPAPSSSACQVAPTEDQEKPANGVGMGDIPAAPHDNPTVPTQVAYTMNDIRELLRYKREVANFEGWRQRTFKPVVSVQEHINYAHSLAYNAPQPRRLREEDANTLSAYRRLLRESLALLHKELDEPALLYFVGEVADRHGHTIDELWLLPVEEFGRLMDCTPAGYLPNSAEQVSEPAQRPEATVSAAGSPPVSDAAKDSHQFTFAISGNTYQVAGFGESGHLPASLKGLSTIAKVIRSPGVPVPWADLEPAILKDAPRTEQPAFDGSGPEDLCRRLREEIETAENDVERADSQRQLEEVLSFLQPVTGLKGKARDLNSLIDNLRPKLWGRINTVIDKLREAAPPMPLLAAHFATHITSSADGFVYNPPTPAPCWKLELDKK